MDNGDPVEPMAVTLDRSSSAAGRRPAFWLAATNGADVPNRVTRCFSASRQSVIRSGCPGLPS